jgi:hypothetical protein
MLNELPAAECCLRRRIEERLAAEQKTFDPNELDVQPKEIIAVVIEQQNLGHGKKGRESAVGPYKLLQQIGEGAISSRQLHRRVMIPSEIASFTDSGPYAPVDSSQIHFSIASSASAGRLDFLVFNPPSLSFYAELWRI